jgi:hypothetical protein
MNNLKITKCCFIVAAIALLAVFVAAPAGAGNLNWKLRGDYTYNVAATCAHAACGINPTTVKFDCQTAPGFNPVTLALRVPGSQKSYSYNVQGVMHFDGHGKYTLKGEILVIRTSLGINPPDIPVTQLDLDADGTYVVDSKDNGLFVDITFPTYTATVKSSGPYQGFVYNFSGPVTLRGRLDTVEGGGTVIISQTVPEIEELEIMVPPGVGMNEQRICNPTGSLVQLSPRKNWLSKE